MTTLLQLFQLLEDTRLDKLTRLKMHLFTPEQRGAFGTLHPGHLSAGHAFLATGVTLCCSQPQICYIMLLLSFGAVTNFSEVLIIYMSRLIPSVLNLLATHDLKISDRRNIFVITDLQTIFRTQFVGTKIHIHRYQ
jgi:hypothetical protein